MIREHNINHQEKDNDQFHIDQQLNANRLWQEMRLDLIEKWKIKRIKLFFLEIHLNIAKLLREDMAIV